MNINFTQYLLFRFVIRGLSKEIILFTLIYLYIIHNTLGLDLHKIILNYGKQYLTNNKEHEIG